MAGGDYRCRPGVTDPQRTAVPTVTLLEGSVSQRTGALVPSFETHEARVQWVTTGPLEITNCRNGGWHGGMYGWGGDNSGRTRYEGWCGSG